MIISHNGKTPVVHPTAWVARDATVCGDVSIGAHTRVLFGAKLIAEGIRLRPRRGQYGEDHYSAFQSAGFAYKR